MVYFILSVVTAPFSFSSQMSNHSQQLKATLYLALFTPSECIAWITVLGIEFVVVLTLNALVIIIYLRERSLEVRKRSMYLVINQTVANMFVGGFVISRGLLLGNSCAFWVVKFPNIASFALMSAYDSFFPLVSLLNLTAISLDQGHATFRPFKHRLVKKKIFGGVIAAV